MSAVFSVTLEIRGSDNKHMQKVGTVIEKARYVVVMTAVGSIVAVITVIARDSGIVSALLR